MDEFPLKVKIVTVQRHSCLSQFVDIFAIRQIIEKSKEFNKSTCITFIDFITAFDSVSREHWT